jgi:hypothetical protein
LLKIVELVFIQLGVIRLVVVVRVGVILTRLLSLLDSPDALGGSSPASVSLDNIGR